MKKISEKNLNSYIANEDINVAVEASGEEITSKGVRLAKIVLRNSPTHKLKANIPMYAFVKNLGNKIVAKFLTNGMIVIFENPNLLSVSEVKGTFSLKGVLYGIKDTINGLPRYEAKKA